MSLVKSNLLLFGVLVAAFLTVNTEAAFGQDPYIGEIRMFAGNFAPRGWALCSGQLLSISQYTALFSILGTTYGGDGRVTFALPDLRGRAPVHAGQGPGLSNRNLGQSGGEESHVLTTNEIPSHTHQLRGDSSVASTDMPANSSPARNAGGIPSYGNTADINMSPGAIQSTGAGQGHNNMQPYLTVNFIIALEGIFPPRN
jgi:microcystin-dependent protein